MQWIDRSTTAGTAGYMARMALAFLLLLLAVAVGGVAETGWVAIPPAEWTGNLHARIAALNEPAAAAVIAAPVREATPLVVTSAQPQPAGLYALRLTLRPSHVAGVVAFHSGLRLKVNDMVAADFPGQYFARVHQPEARVAQILQPADGPLRLRLEAYTDATALKTARVDARQAKGGPDVEANNVLDGEKADNTADAGLTPDSAVYYLVDKVEFRPLSHSGQVVQVACDKIRYLPGATLTGSALVQDVGGKGGSGTVNLYLEHTLADREKVKSLPVTLSTPPQTLTFDIPLPKEELGYALVAEYVSADGADHSEAAEYFTIAANFQRVALFGANPGGTRDVTQAEEPIRQALTASRRDYYNACEYPFWAPDDLLAMTPATDYWFSGQANYHMNKQTLQRQIRLAHAQGIAMVTYGKWCVSGPAGWEAVYDRPGDFTGTYSQPIGSWDSHNTWVFDLRRNGEQVPYSPRPHGKGPWFDDWWNDFVGITPDSSLSMIRSAAEETARSVEMFGWDAIRWDGHPRAGWNACGRSGQYDAWAARQTQTLVRYFKDVMARQQPDFRHGYNYFLIEKNKGYEWAKEDFELDELARGGGLLMNESIGNASGGWSFAEIANNLQVEGDLSRERGGCYLGISFAASPRDRLIESALWAAAGCRPYNNAMTREVRRYCTRFAQFTLDERLRRLATPEKVLAPQTATRLWWQPFVYETPLDNGRRQLVVNLLNLPVQDKRPPRDGKAAPVWNMPPGTDPVVFALTLPDGLRATGANLIDPQTLETRPLELRDNHFEAPAVAAWSVAVIDLAVAANAPSLGALYGPPQTFGVKRATLPDAQRLPEVAIDPTREVWEVNKNMAVLQPDWVVKGAQAQAALDAMTPTERMAALQQKRAAQTLESLTSQWWKGGVLPDDLKRKDGVVDYGDLTPRRNGRMDIFYGRGPMDYRLRMTEAIAGLNRFAVHDAPFWGSFRGGGLGNMGLGDNVPWQRYPEYDLLLFTGIPYAAIGIDNCYGMVPYVKAGGAVFFTGGEWAFGKGGYLLTVLERELLPVLCTELKDSRTCDKPVAMEPGKDFAELGYKADFAAKPSFWVYNQVLLKDDPGVKVFLTSSKGPVLVGWQVGKGRVACLLVDHRGKSANGVTAFFDWADWPGLARAVFTWLAPDAGTVTAPANVVVAAPPAKGGGKRTEDEHAAALRKLLSAPASAIDTAAVLEQLMTERLPDDLCWTALDCVLAHPPATLAEQVHAGLEQQDPAIRQLAWQCLGAVEPAAVLPAIANAPQAIEPDVEGRLYALTLTIPLVKTAELVTEGRRRVAQWNAAEKDVLDQWTGGKGFSPAAPELPGLDAESLFQRVAWLAYLSRHDPKTFGAQFAREWLMTGVYQEYCQRSLGNRRAGDWARLRTHFGRLRDVTRPALDELLKAAPDALATGFSQAHFTREFQAAMNYLGEQDRAATAGILTKLKSARNPDLAAFAAARLSGK